MSITLLGKKPFATVVRAAASVYIASIQYFFSMFWSACLRLMIGARSSLSSFMSVVNVVMSDSTSAMKCFEMSFVVS